MPELRLLADDLTGALDTAAEFTGATGPVAVFSASVLPQILPPSAAIDSATRERDAATASLATARLAPLLAPAAARISYCKLDSLLRGHPARAIAACLAATPFRTCIIAPAFPFQHRATRAGLQYALSPERPGRTGPDLRADLAALGLPLTLARPGDPVPAGVSLWDAETDTDLAHIAAAGLALPEPPLWCGSAGLAAALGRPSTITAPPPLPLLGLFGSDHPVTAAQLRAASPHHLPLPDASPASIAALAARLGATAIALVSFALPPGLPRPVAAARIASETNRLLAALPHPGSLLVSGGETLRAVSSSLGATHLQVLGRLMPGVPVSLLRGSRWDSLPLISKSGAFGDESLLARLAAAALSPPALAPCRNARP